MNFKKEINYYIERKMCDKSLFYFWQMKTDCEYNMAVLGSERVGNFFVSGPEN